jgi:hypothetical protein
MTALETREQIAEPNIDAMLDVLFERASELAFRVELGTLPFPEHTHNRVGFFDLLTFVLSQLPSIGIVFGYDQFSLYQPAFYREEKPFLLIPLMVGLFATWKVMRDHRAMYLIFPIFLCLATINYVILKFVPPTNGLHSANWILSYCTFALFVAAAMRFVAEMIGYRTSA